MLWVFNLIAGHGAEIETEMRVLTVEEALEGILTTILSEIDIKISFPFRSRSRSRERR